MTMLMESFSETVKRMNAWYQHKRDCPDCRNTQMGGCSKGSRLKDAHDDALDEWNKLLFGK